MAELEVDQSNLPRVQEVRQCFAVLEDGALAYNLQEQEIEQYYSSNVQRSQLVQNDLRVAKRLQDEEQQRLFVLHRQSAQQLEEQDSEYARRIQEDIQRCADETRIREKDDEEIAKQIQEEEELRVRELYESHATDGGPGLHRARVPLDLGELEQVLLDEELARRLQAEEEESIRRDSSVSPSQNHFSEGDFTVAQVAQDEELAHYMQKREVQAHRHSRELDHRGWREGGGADLCDEGGDFERQREGVDSDVLLSPSEACSLEFQPPSPTAMATQQQPFRNIAEDLDPTFQRKENVQSGQNIPGPCPFPASPAFVAPTKRHNDKPGRVKSREKRENTKPKESCKQQ